MLAFWLMVLSGFAFLFYPDLRLIVPMTAFAVLAWAIIGFSMLRAAFAARLSQDAKERKEFGGYLVTGCIFLFVGCPAGLYALVYFARNQMP
jgi:hypothetical protein